jgi:DNA-binding transcriptional regulator YiaG
MPRMNVYLPDDLYQMVKREHLSASDILQEALRAQAAVQERLAALDEYIADLQAELGPASEEDIRQAEELTQRILAHDLGASQADPSEDDFDEDELDLPSPPVRTRRAAAKPARREGSAKPTGKAS